MPGLVPGIHAFLVVVANDAFSPCCRARCRHFLGWALGGGFEYALSGDWIRGGVNYHF